VGSGTRHSGGPYRATASVSKSVVRGWVALPGEYTKANQRNRYDIQASGWGEGIIGIGFQLLDVPGRLAEVVYLFVLCHDLNCEFNEPSVCLASCDALNLPQLAVVCLRGRDWHNSRVLSCDYVCSAVAVPV
jgi:hypothetical protein